MCSRMRPSLKMALVLAIGLSSCSDLLGPDKDKIPYGYDPSFNYLPVLKASPPYAYESVDRLPLFTYQDSSDSNLRVLRERYHFTEIAGNGDELSRIFNLLRWVHDSLRHDGGVRVEPENSLRILQYHEQSGKGVNCVMMAIVLNEAYLAMGFASRVIHGNARDWVFNGEWHTFNAVYASTLGKWVFVDPMMSAHFTSSSGVPLGPGEIREYLRKDLPIHMNSDAEYNGQPANAAAYVHYLTKNLYRFSTSLHSAFGNYWMFHLPDEATRNYVHLDPRGDPQEGLFGGSNHFTSNPDYYWSLP